MDAVRLSKLLAFVLRHRPDSVGVRLDAEGWTDVAELLKKLNDSRRLEGPLDREGLAHFIEEEGGARFELSGDRVRARSGHTAPGISPRKPVLATPPDFLFFGALRERVGRYLSDSGLAAEPGRWLRLHESERAARRAALGDTRAKARVVVVEAQRAGRHGVTFYRTGEPGVFLVSHVPRRYLLSERPGFERQVSAGVVLVRRFDGELEIALIRTRPRGDAEPVPEDSSIDVSFSHDPDQPSPLYRPKPPRASGLATPIPPPRVAPRAPSEERPIPSDSDVNDVASSSGEGSSSDERSVDSESDAGLGSSDSDPVLDPVDRRFMPDRRRVDEGPPGGVERRQSTRRRRCRRGGWGPEGRVELPKGKLEAGETAHQAAVRELREETGLVTPVDLVRELPRVRYAFRTPEGKSVYKVVHYFLLLSRDPAPKFIPQGKEGIVAVEWTKLRSALESIAFGNLRPVLEAARDALLSGEPPQLPSTSDDDLFPD